MPPNSISNVSFFNENIKVNLANRNKLKKNIEIIFRNENKKLNSLNCIFCNDKTLLSINKKYLNHNELTDIITFDLSDDDSIQGEIYISIERVKENAGQLNLTLKEELLRVIFHGVLHLCGYGDKSLKEKKIMREKEDYYLNRFLR